MKVNVNRKNNWNMDGTIPAKLSALMDKIAANCTVELKKSMDLPENKCLIPYTEKILHIVSDISYIAMNTTVNETLMLVKESLKQH